MRLGTRTPTAPTPLPSSAALDARTDGFSFSININEITPGGKSFSSRSHFVFAKKKSTRNCFFARSGRVILLRSLSNECHRGRHILGTVVYGAEVEYEPLDQMSMLCFPTLWLTFSSFTKNRSCRKEEHC